MYVLIVSKDFVFYFELGISGLLDVEFLIELFSVCELDDKKPHRKCGYPLAKSDVTWSSYLELNACKF